jgi:hypothetical protein
MTPVEAIISTLMPRWAGRHLDVGSRGPDQLAIKMSPAKPENILSCEIDEETIASCRKPCFYGNCLELTKFLKPKSFDLVTAIDIIEHLDKDSGKRLLLDIESLCSGRIIYGTPFGEWAVYPGVKYHCHLSGWLPSEFIDRGYAVLNFPKQIDTGWFFAIKDFKKPVIKPVFPIFPPPFDEWEWLQ